MVDHDHAASGTVPPVQTDVVHEPARKAAGGPLGRQGRSRPRSARLAHALLRSGPYVPLWGMQLFGLTVGWLAGLLPTRSRSRCLANLRACLPELSAREHRRLARRSLASVACLAAELPVLWARDQQRILALCREVEGEDVLERAVSAGRGVLLMVPHLGAWELISLFVSSRLPMTALYSPNRVAELDQAFLDGRARFGGRLVPVGVGAVRALRRALRDGEVAAVLPDVEPRRGQAVFAPFFGVPASTGTLLPRLAHESGAAVVVCVAERLGLGRGYRISFREGPADIGHADPQRGAEAMNRAIEDAVRSLPGQYLWRYRRFRTRPEGMAPLYAGKRG